MGGSKATEGSQLVMKISKNIAVLSLVLGVGLLGASAPAAGASPGASAGSEIQWETIATAVPTGDTFARGGWGTTPITCQAGYDMAHPGTSSAKRKVNAHLIVKCKGTDAGKVIISLKSRMREGGRSGVPSFRKGKKEVRVGGDLACLSAPRMYQAIGDLKMLFPTGYNPIYHSNTKYSKPKKFKRNKYGICLAVK